MLPEPIRIEIQSCYPIHLIPMRIIRHLRITRPLPAIEYITGYRNLPVKTSHRIFYRQAAALVKSMLKAQLRRKPLALVPLEITMRTIPLPLEGRSYPRRSCSPNPNSPPGSNVSAR